MKKVLLVMIGLSFLGLEALAQQGQGRGRGHDIGRGKGHEISRGRGHQDRDDRGNRENRSNMNRRNRGNGNVDHGRGNGNGRNGSYDRNRGSNDRNRTVVYRSSSRRSPVVRGRETVIIRHAPGIRYTRPIVWRPRVVIRPAVRVAYTYAPILSTADIDLIAQRMSYASFDDDALAIAKAEIRNFRLTATDAAFLVQILRFEGNRLDLAKFAWHRTADRQNYNLVFNELKFRSSQQDLDRYIYRY